MNYALNDFTNKFSEESSSIEAISISPQIKALVTKLAKVLLRMQQNGLTTALWVQYLFNKIELMKKFINAAF